MDIRYMRGLLGKTTTARRKNKMTRPKGSKNKKNYNNGIKRKSRKTKTRITVNTITGIDNEISLLKSYQRGYNEGIEKAMQILNKK